MSHKKHITEEQDKFYDKRQYTQRHLTDIVPNNRIQEVLEGFTPEQIAVLSTLIFNLYEEKYRHIWFPKGVRETHMEDIIKMIEAVKNSPFTRPLPFVFTGMGIDDATKGFK
jgi:hypothetical protein